MSNQCPRCQINKKSLNQLLCAECWALISGEARAIWIRKLTGAKVRYENGAMIYDSDG